MGDSGNWCLIESDPGLFTELLDKIGVKGVQVEELYGLDKDLLVQFGKVHGLVFLFKWQADNTLQPVQHEIPNLFFARQKIQNACATQAILNIIMNAEIDVGDELRFFKEFTQQMQPDDIGWTIGNSDTIRSVHNSFSRPEVFTMERTSDEEEDAFHFVAYIPFNGRLYELDGLQPAPIDHGAIGADWLDDAVRVLQGRIERYANSEIRFNLMAVVQDQRETLNKRIEELTAAAQENPELQSQMDEEIADLKQRIQDEERKREKSKVENNRRRHNYIPFFLELLKVMAEEGKLDEAVKVAKEKGAERVKAYMEKKKSKEAK